MKSIYTLTLISMLAFVACNDDDGIQQIELILDTDRFDRIRLETSADIRIIQSDFHKVVITGIERDVNDVEVRVINERLTIEENHNHNEDLLIKVFVDEISDLEIPGSSFVYGESYFTQARDMNIFSSGSGELDFAIDTEDLDVEMTGSGDVYLEGDVRTLNADVSGSGWLRAFNLTADLADVRIEGSGSAEVTVDTDLDVFISGSGDVFYKGHPFINAQIPGTGAVIDAN